MREKFEVSIIIVHYKAKHELFECLHLIKNSRPKSPFEVIVVDNDERKTIGEELREKFPGVKYIKAPGNIGFGAGNNLGAEQARGEYLFFLNPDTKVLPRAIDELANFIKKNKKVGIVAPLLLNTQGQPYPIQGTDSLTPISGIIALSFINKLFPRNPISKRYWVADWDKKEPREIRVVPGSAFLIRKSVFEQIDGFDERFFLYFEEADLCKRAREAGWKLYIDSRSQVVHIWEASTKKEKPEKIKKIFTQSRFLYFRKHYGVIWATVVYLFTSFSKWHAMFLSTLFLGTFLRFFRIGENFTFAGEIGDNLLDIKSALEMQQVPLLGPPTSHPWLSFGPLYYWIYGPILVLSGFNPLSHAYLGVFVSLLIIPLNFFVVREIFNQKVALVSSFLIAISPLFLESARGARFFSLVPLFVYPFLFLLYKVAQGEKKYLLWLALVFGVMLNFHYTPLLLIPFAITVLLVKRVKITRRDIGVAVLGFLLPLTPILLNELINKGAMIPKLLAWIPYRVAGFVGIYPKNTVSAVTIKENLDVTVNFFRLSFLPQTEQVLGLVIVLILSFWLLFKLLGRLTFAWFFLLTWFLWGFLALFIHGSPPMHYFVPLFPLPILFFSLFVVELWNDERTKAITFFVLLALTVINLRFYFSENWFFLQQEKVVFAPHRVPYKLQLETAAAIVKDASGQRFSLQRVGPYDQFEENYAQNYRYLLWWFGNEPVSESSLRYTIYEDSDQLPKDIGEEQVFWKSNIAILKENGF